MAKPEKFGHLHLVYHFTVPLKMSFELKCEGNSKFSIVPKFFTLFEIFHFLCARFLLSYTFKNKQNFLRIIKIPNIFIFPKIKKKKLFGQIFSNSSNEKNYSPNSFSMQLFAQFLFGLLITNLIFCNLHNHIFLAVYVMFLFSSITLQYQ